PSLDYSTLYGGSGQETGRAVAVDSLGRPVMAGTVNNAGVTSAFLVKLDPFFGIPMYTTLVAGGSSDEGDGVEALDENTTVVVGASSGQALWIQMDEVTRVETHEVFGGSG